MLQTRKNPIMITFSTGEFAEISERYYDGFKYIYVLKFNEIYERIMTGNMLQNALKTSAIRMSF